MELNITIVIQAIHFFIAYSIMERWFFRKALTIIQNRDQVLQEQETQVLLAQQDITVTNARISEQWQTLQKELSQNIPTKEYQPADWSVPSVAQPPTPPPDQQQKMIEQEAARIIAIVSKPIEQLQETA